jgi:hypothetical protein
MPLGNYLSPVLSADFTSFQEDPCHGRYNYGRGARTFAADAALIAAAALAASLTALAFRGSLQKAAAQGLLVLAKPVNSTQPVPGDKAARPAIEEKNKPG